MLLWTWRRQMGWFTRRTGRPIYARCWWPTTTAIRLVDNSVVATARLAAGEDDVWTHFYATNDTGRARQLSFVRKPIAVWHFSIERLHGTWQGCLLADWFYQQPDRLPGLEDGKAICSCCVLGGMFVGGSIGAVLGAWLSTRSCAGLAPSTLHGWNDFYRGHGSNNASALAALTTLGLICGGISARFMLNKPTSSGKTGAA